MLDFMKISTRETKGGIEVYPKFIIRSSDDLMIRGSDFYAIWDEEKKLWSTNEVDALEMIDKEIRKEVDRINEKRVEGEKKAYGAWMWDSDNKMIDRFHHLVKKQLRDNSHPLDAKLIFSNMETTKKDYASKKLPYPLEACPTPAWDELIGTLYFPTERHKIEWAIGAIVSGESKDIQKFLVMYGPPGSGKSTIINIIQDLFTGYWQPFDSKVLGSANAAFALEAFLSNPLVAIQHDGNLSRIEDNTRLNSLISHETMVMNEKFRTSYSIRFNSFLIMATNAPVKITDSKSGLIRRLIDVSPSGKKIKRSRYDDLMNTVKFELGGIACKCLDIFKEDPRCYDDYIPTTMIGASNDFYNFILDSYDIFKRDNKTTLKAAYEMYKVYCDEARVPYPYPMRIFKEELKSYFKKYEERSDEVSATGQTIMNLYSGFIADKFITLDTKTEKPHEKKSDSWIKFGASLSLLDVMLADCFAQYANSKGTPKVKWSEVESKVSDIDTRKLHYILMNDPHHIAIDFDLKNENGEKDLKLNIEAASKWPKTYCELSQGGQGLHLHYIYTGNPEDLSRVYDDNIEIKVFTGNSSLRRRLSDCNDIPVAKISSGLPLKEENKKVIDFEGFKNEKAIRTYIKRNMLKEYVPSTKQSVSFIFDALNKMYESGIEYDVSDMAQQVITFAGRSSNNAAYCLGLCDKMKWKSETLSENFEKYDSDTIVFFDVEVFPNLFVVVYKAQGKNPISLINPTPADIAELMKFKLVGYNNRKFDNHILYARMLGDSEYALYKRSRRIIINDDKEAYIGKAWNISYTDILDFAAKKQSLKKWEIELGIHHQELGLPWDQEVPENLWPKVAEYCTNDVVSTEAVFNHLQGDFIARKILAELAGGTANDSTNKLTGKLIFGSDKRPQSKFQYRNLAEPVYELQEDMEKFLRKNFPKMMAQKHGEAGSLLPYFPGYEFTYVTLANGNKKEKSTYRGYELGEGGLVWAKLGMYENAWTFDVESEHPSSVCAEYLFGPYTENFYDILQSRLAIKHEDYESAKNMFGGRLAPFLGEGADPKGISSAEKIAINACYGLTAQKEKGDYQNIFRDKRNVDNIVAKRGSLFMADLLEALLERGDEPFSTKTDSVKVVNPSEETQKFIFEFGQRYGYKFEIEHKFEKICLVNKSVFVAKMAVDDSDWLKSCKKAAAKGKPEPTRWTATGKQFQVPYVFKTLFSKEPLVFDDFCETKEVKDPAALYLDLNEGLNEGEHNYQFIGKVGQFTPVLPGHGGGSLLVKRDENKYDNAQDTRGYLWLESEKLRDMDPEYVNSIIDRTYYKKKVDDAADAISKYCDIEWFCS